jgi:hypothetical protein
MTPIQQDGARRRTGRVGDLSAEVVHLGFADAERIDIAEDDTFLVGRKNQSSRFEGEPPMKGSATLASDVANHGESQRGSDLDAGSRGTHG